jgi:hypothetical protein
VAFIGVADGKFNPDSPEVGDCRVGALTVVGAVVGKLSPPKASASPPKASFCCEGDDMAPKEDCRSCEG